MASGDSPYSDLRGRFEARRRAYLTMLTSTHGLPFGRLFLLARQLGVIGRATVRMKVRDVLVPAGDSQTDRPDYNPVRTFDPDVIESVIELLDRGGKPDGAADTAAAVALLAGIRVEDTEQPITEPEVRALITDLGRLIPGAIVDRLIGNLGTIEVALGTQTALAGELKLTVTAHAAETAMDDWRARWFGLLRDTAVVQA
jgi:hypothetical protein